MTTQIELLAEANRRGLLPPDKAALFAEAQKRGLVKPETGFLEVVGQTVDRVGETAGDFAASAFAVPVQAGLKIQQLVADAADAGMGGDTKLGNIAKTALSPFVDDPAVLNEIGNMTLDDLRSIQVDKQQQVQGAVDTIKERSPNAALTGQIGGEIATFGGFAPKSLVAGGATFLGLQQALKPRTVLTGGIEALQETGVDAALGLAGGAALGKGFQYLGKGLVATPEYTSKMLDFGKKYGKSMSGAIAEGAKRAQTFKVVQQAENTISQAAQAAAQTRGAVAAATAGKAANNVLKAGVETVQDTINALGGNVRVIVGSLKERANTPETNLGLAIEESTGATLTASQLTGSPIARAAEKGARTRVELADKFRDILDGQVLAAHNKLTQISERIGATPAESAKITQELRKTHNAAVEAARETRRNQAKVEFEHAKAMGANGEIVELGKFQEFFDAIIREGTAKGAPETSRVLMNKILKQVHPYLKPNSTQFRQITIDELQTMLEQWGKLSAGKGKNFLQQEKSDAIITGKRAFASLNQDLTNLAATTGGEAGKALKVARNNYEINSRAIDSISDHAIVSLLNRLQGKGLATGEGNLVDVVMKTAESGDRESLKQIVNFVNEKSPDLLKQIQSGIISRAITRATEAGRKAQQSPQIKGQDISADVLKSSLPSPAAAKILFPNQPEIAREIELVFHLLKRATRELGGSPTTEKASGSLFISGAQGVMNNFMGKIVANDAEVMAILLDKNARQRFISTTKGADKKELEKFFNDLDEVTK